MCISPTVLKIFDAVQCRSMRFNVVQTHSPIQTSTTLTHIIAAKHTDPYVTGHQGTVTYPLSSVTRTFTPLKSVRKWVDTGAGVICRSESLGFSGRPTLTTKITVVPLPKPSLSIQMWPSIRFTNLQHHKQQFTNETET